MHGSKPAPGRLKRWAALALLALVLAAVAAAVATTLGAPAHPRRSAALAGGVLRPGKGSILSRLPAELAAGSAESPQGPYRLGEVLAGFRSGVSPARRLAIEHAAGATSARRLGRPVKPVGHGRTTAQEYPAPMELRVPDTQVFAAIRRLKRFAEVAYAEPNYLQVASATPNKPNDLEFGKQWGDENAEQPIPFQDQTEKLGAEEKGTAGADDKASFAWNVTTGSRKIVIGEVDTGVAYEHPDLAANIWSNPGGINGCAAGTHGYNVLAKTCNPIDEDGSYNGHGTHVAGIIGAVGNNGAGVAGMNWQTTILPVRWLNSAGSETSALIEALNWLVLAKQAGVNVRVVNDSDVFPGTAKSEALSKEIETLGSNNILFVSAAGNNGSNLEAEPHYPCAYDLPNEICVTASNNKDALPSWANTGERKVQLAAPGVSIFSTLRGNSYGWLSGGSMAAPQVSGAAALILSVKEMSTAELKEDILKNVDRLPAYEKKVESGGRLNVCKALPGCSEPSPPPKEETLGKTAVGGATDAFGTERKRVNCYALPTSGSVTKLRVYLEHTTTSGQQMMKGVIYSDPSGKPENLLALSEPLTFKSTNAAGWYELPFSAPVNLSAGNYCIGVLTGATEKVAGFRWDSVSGSRFYNLNAYSSGPTNPFGSATIDTEQTSLYATYSTIPVNTGLPKIAGTAQQGKTLTEERGTWANEPTSYGYNWQQCDSVGNNCTAIAGATGQTYTPVAGDVGHAIRVQETATNAKGSSSPATSAATAVVVPPAPTNTSPPTITGSAQQGKTLTEVNGKWTNEPTSYSYQWQQCDGSGNNCTSVAAATEQTYKPAAGDVNHTLRVVEKATNAGGSGEASSAATPVVLPAPPVSKTPPTIEGKAQQGQALAEAHGTWENSPTGFSYQWQQCDGSGNNCTNIAAATEQTYKPVAGDVGHTIKVVERATNAGGSGEATSAATAAVLIAAPVNKTPPTIEGRAQQGQTLTEAHGTWDNSPAGYSYQWQQCDGSGNNCTNIAAATEQTYKPVAGDKGHALRVVEKATNAGGSGQAPSAPTTPVVPPAPVNNTPPTIEGKAQQGQTLTEVRGTWENSPTGFTYQWQQCNGEGTPASCTNIAAASEQVYKPAAGDVGHALRVLEKATNAGGSGEAASAATAVVLPAPPVNNTPPTIEGKAQQGQTLTEIHGNWENGPTGFAYQWQQCNGEGTPASCTNIAAATEQTYKPVPGDVGHALRVVEKATNAGGSGEATSAPTAPVSAPVPVLEQPPTIIGVAQQGQTMTEVHGKWSNNPTSYSYQWLQCNSEGTLSSCANIAGATAQTYTPGPGDVGHAIRVQETAINGAGSSTPATSAPTEAVKPPSPKNSLPPTIEGKAQQGQTLTEHHGTWTNSPTGFSYQWQECNGEGTPASCNNISGATEQTYKPVEGDLNHALRVMEKATNAGGSGEATSAATATVVAPAPVNKTPPTIEGKAQQGQTLTEVHGTWENNPAGFTYQWQQCNSLGEGCLPINGAAKQTYEPAAGDVGQTLKVVEKATNAGGSGEATSAATATVVPPAPVNKTPPTIEGKAQQGQTLSEVHGTWENSPTGYTYQWQQCDGSGNNCVSIAAATEQSYKPAEGDVNHLLRVVEKATNAGGSGESTSAATTPVVAPAPVNKTLPTIEGKAQQGQTLTAVHGTWESNPTGYSYQWQQCDGEGTPVSCTNIAAASEQAYKPVAGDVGHALRVLEKATNAGGSGEATSAATAAVLIAAPAAKTPPTIEGKAQLGQTLTEAHGTWDNSPTGYTYQWQQCDGSGNNCTNVAAATEQTYKPVAGDVGHTIKVVERATNAGGSGESPSAATAVVTPPPPVDETPPTITGAGQQGQTLTEHNGKWTNNPTGYAYQWLRCNTFGTSCLAITGATEQTYNQAPGDVGHTIAVQEVASNAGGSGAPATSETTAVVLPSAAPSNTAPPTITGEARQGQTLTEHPGSWANEPTGFAYQWLRCDTSANGCVPISTAAGQTYVLAAADVNHTIKVQEEATNGLGSSTATSAATAVVLPPPPTSTSPPTIEGKAQQGQTLTEVHATWENNPTGFTYRWQQCDGGGTPASCTNISGATEQTYRPVEGDVGHALRVAEKATNAGGSGEAISAATTPVVPPPPVNKAPPTIEGKAQQGQTLTEVHGNWENNPTGFTYQWQQCDGGGTPASCTNISGATEQTYKPVEGDVGHAVRVAEKATNAGGSGEATSAATAAVLIAAPVAKAPPTIEGKAQQGQTLSEVHGSWENNPTGFAYQWQQCDSSGNSCANISGAASQAYVVAASDVGHELRVQETASNAGGTSAPASSAATAAVLGAPPASSSPPTITGTAQQGQTLTEHAGSWTNSPTSFNYHWLQCDSLGNSCLPISGALSQTYVLAGGDVGYTIRAQEEAHNAAGAGGPATSTPTAVVGGTFGTTSVGASNDSFLADRKRVNRYALSTAGSVSKLSIYLAPTTTAGQQLLKGLIYADSSNAPAALLGVSEQLTFKNTNSAGWYDLKFASSVKLAAGNYWIGVITGATSNVAGFRYASVASSREYNANTYASGPTNPFGAPSTDAEQTSLYATYTPGS